MSPLLHIRGSHVFLSFCSLSLPACTVGEEARISESIPSQHFTYLIPCLTSLSLLPPMPSTVQNTTTTQGARPKTSTLSPQIRPIDAPPSASHSPTNSAPVSTESSNVSSATATNLKSRPVVTTASSTLPSAVLLSSLCFFYIFVQACVAWNGQRRSCVRSDEETTVHPNASGKSREGASNPASLEESSNQSLASEIV